LIDDFSSYYQVYLSHAKDKALVKFRILNNEYDLHYETVIKILRCRECYDPSYF